MNANGYIYCLVVQILLPVLVALAAGGDPLWAAVSGLVCSTLFATFVVALPRTSAARRKTGWVIATFAAFFGLPCVSVGVALFTAGVV